MILGLYLALVFCCVALLHFCEDSTDQCVSVSREKKLSRVVASVPPCAVRPGARSKAPIA